MGRQRRGFNGEFAQDMLVLIDGRTVYTPASSGVFWDAQDVVMEDVDRIEVIRGPGATLWGANAVNGVINVITKSAQETQGGLVSGGAGSALSKTRRRCATEGNSPPTSTTGRTPSGLIKMALPQTPLAAGRRCLGLPPTPAFARIGNHLAGTS